MIGHWRPAPHRVRGVRRWSIMHRVTIAAVCTTMGRPERHEGLYGVFVSQTAEGKSLHVLDESRDPSPFFVGLKDPRVHYRHEPSSGVRGDVTTIGASRNRLMATVPADIIAHFDDDDVYAPIYLDEMRRRLGDSDLAKLSVWNALLEHDGTIWQWDTRQMGGKHYAVRGSEIPVEVEVPAGGDPMTADWTLWGYGFSYVFRRSLWERVPFPAEGTEDYPWVAECRRQGARCVLVADAPELCLHTVHPKSASAIFPQKRLAGVLVGSSLRALAGQRMLAGAAASYRLPSGKDIDVQAGATYHVLAYLKKKHSLRSVVVRAQSWGVSVMGARDDVPASEVGIDPAPADYRIVQIQGRASRAGHLPWKVPAMIEAAFNDRSRVVVAWSDRPPPMAVVVPHELGLHRVEYRHVAGVPKTLGDAQSQAFQDKLKSAFVAKGTEYLLTETGLSAITSVAAYVKLIADIASGNYAQAAIDGEILLLSTWGGPIGVALGSLIVGIEAIYGADHPSPCTIVGCGPTFSLPECDNFPDGKSPFTWASIASMGPAPPPAPDAYGKMPGSWLTNWGDYYWLCTGTPPYVRGINCAASSPMPTMAGGPGSFEDGLQQALMGSWDEHATAPSLCKLMKQAGLDGVIYFGTEGNELAIWRYLFAAAGAMVPAFVSAWNKSHDVGTVSQGGATEQWCGAQRGKWIVGPHASGNYCEYPAPQRKVTYGPWPGGLTASGLSTGDPLNAAFYGLAQLAGLPASASISVMVNGGPLKTATAIAAATKQGWSTAETVGVVAGGTLALGAIGTSLYAWHTKRTFGQALKHLTGWPWTGHHKKREARRR